MNEPQESEDSRSASVDPRESVQELDNGAAVESLSTVEPITPAGDCGQDLKQDPTSPDKKLASFLVHLRTDCHVKEQVCLKVAEFIHTSATQAVKEAREHPEVEVANLPTVSAGSSFLSLRRFRKCISESGYVQPKTIVLGTTTSGALHTYQYVPLLDQLDFLIRHKPILDSITSTGVPNPDVYEDWYTLLLSQKVKEGLYFHLYYDEFQTVNPVGNKTKKGKLGAIYFVIGTTPFHSKKEHIFLLSIFKSAYFTGPYKEAILKRIVDDVKVFESKGLKLCGTEKL